MGDYYLRQRYYDTSTGRFTRRDTYEGRLDEPLTLHKYIYGNSNPVNFTDPTSFSALAEYNSSSLAVAALIAGILLTGYQISQQAGEFSTREDIDDFVDAYTYFAKKSDPPSDGKAQENINNDGGEGSTQRHGGGKNAQHGKAENLPSHERQLQELEDKLRNASGRKEKTQISNKIKNLRREMDRRKSGENHSQRDKR